MSAAMKQHLRARTRSREPSIDPYTRATPLANASQTSLASAGTKRLFSNRQQARAAHDTSQNGEFEAEDNDDHEPEATPRAMHSDKRQRSSDWPLTNPSPASYTSSAPRRPLRTRSPPNSPSLRRPNSLQRSSKFMEGSMNDRTSAKPPTTYLGGDEELQESYVLEQQDPSRPGRRARHLSYGQQQHPVSVSGETDTSRHSSIFRFGKSLAASFNPSNWKIFSSSKAGEEQDDEVAAQQRILRERQVKAERIYKELKESGHFRDSTINHPKYGGFGSVHGKHDSGVAFASEDGGRPSSRMSTDSRTSTRDKRTSTGSFKPVQLNPHRGASIISDADSYAQSSASSPKKKPSHVFKKPSLSNIKKVFTSQDAKLSTDDLGRSARRIPSRKDLQTQQKLVKRVSDLEDKLAAARRKLNESLGEPMPTLNPPPPRIGRSRFVPGAMPTLPSERLLTGYINPEDEEGSEQEEIGKAVARASDLARLELSRVSTASRKTAASGKLKFRVKSLAQDRPIQSIEQTPSRLSRDVKNDLAGNSKMVTTEDSEYKYDTDEEVEDSDSGEHGIVVQSESSDNELASEPEVEDKKPITKHGKTKYAAPHVPVAAPFPAPTRAPPPTPFRQPRKRKSVDDEARYKPTHSELEDSDGAEPVIKKKSPVKKKGIPVPKKSAAVTRPKQPTRAAPAPPNKKQRLSPPANDEEGQTTPTKEQKISRDDSNALSPPDATSTPTRAEFTAIQTIQISPKKLFKKDLEGSHAPNGGAALSRSNRISQSQQLSQPQSSITSNSRKQSSSQKASSVLPKSVVLPVSKAHTDLLSASSQASKKLNHWLSDDEAENEDVLGAESPVAAEQVGEHEDDYDPTAIPPMPRLPSTVILPTGEIVNTKENRAKIRLNINPRNPGKAGQTAGDAAGSAVVGSARGGRGKSIRDRKTNSVAEEDEEDQEEDARENIGTRKGQMTKSQTAASFEWPDDVF